MLPVIHVLDSRRTLKNVEVLLEAGAQGCFLINHDFEPEKFLPIIRDTRAAFPSLWMAVNFLAVTGKDAFPVLGHLQVEGCQVDAYWADDACIDENGTNVEAKAIAAARTKSGWDGLYFGGTAFKKQRGVDAYRYGDAAREACPFMDVITTSGAATGQAADLSKIETFRAAIGDRPLALASGISPENAESYSNVDCFMVATGINEPNNFYDLDVGRLTELMCITRSLSKGPKS
ncbi:adenine phosphoribosyltransferase [Pseudopelagicola sp. nBUS_20]|uniref:BtpA/SgcQ family protein n=1 Tax=Pseudopelagicola sp. nBUS_20 TaxID=3395317 RepID=UPI003EBC889A